MGLAQILFIHPDNTTQRRLTSPCPAIRGASPIVTPPFCSYSNTFWRTSWHAHSNRQPAWFYRSCWRCPHCYCFLHPVHIDNPFHTPWIFHTLSLFHIPSPCPVHPSSSWSRLACRISWSDDCRGYFGILSLCRDHCHVYLKEKSIVLDLFQLANK